jgi:hypothetical protein
MIGRRVRFLAARGVSQMVGKLAAERTLYKPVVKVISRMTTPSYVIEARRPIFA